MTVELFPTIKAIDPLRACLLCAYSANADQADAARCWHPRVTAGHGPVPCSDARSLTGDCGPNISLWSSRHEFIERGRTVGKGATRGDD